MSDKRNGIGQIITDRHYGPGIAGSCGSENGDGYLSDVQTYSSNNQSEVSQDFFCSARLLEQHFKDKYKFIRDTYEHRNRQLSEVVNRTCEVFISDDLLREMTVDKTCSAFVPAHIGEVLNRHLDNEREHFIHQLITQLSNTKIELLKSQEIIVHKSKSLAALEPEITRGKKAQSGMDNLQRQLLDMKRQFDHLSSHSEETVTKLQAKNDSLTQQDYQSKEHVKKLLMDLNIKSDAVESLRKSIDDKVRDSSLLESSFEIAADNEKNAKMTEMGDLRMQLRLQSDELVRTQEALKIKIEEGQKSKVQLSAIMAQVETMLEQEVSESDKTIATIREKMKQMQVRLSMDLQQERRLTSVLQEELGNVRRDKEEKARESRQATDDLLLLRDKLSLELQRSAAYHIKLQESQTALIDSKTRITEAENKTKEKVHELNNVNKLKDQELKVEFAKAKMLAMKELESERSSINSEVELRTEAYKKNNENQLKVLQNQMRHSYSFGSTPLDFNKSVNDSTVPWGGEGNTVLDMSMQVALRCAEEKAKVSNILLESEHLISKAKSDAKMEFSHRETVQQLNAKLQEAGGHIDMLRKMAIKGKFNEEENTKNKLEIIELHTHVAEVKGKMHQIVSESRILVQKMGILENERSFEKKCYLDLQNQFATAVQARTDSERTYETKIQEISTKNAFEEIKKREERGKLEEERKRLQDEKKKLEEEKIRTQHEKRKLNDAKEKFEEEYKYQMKKSINLDSFYIDDSVPDNRTSSRYGSHESNDDAEEQIFSLREELSEVRKSLKKLLDERSQDKLHKEERFNTKLMKYDEEHSQYQEHSQHENLDQMLERKTRNEQVEDDEQEVGWGDVRTSTEVKERKWKENNDDNKNRTRDGLAEREIQQLKDLLAATQEQAIEDQKQDAFALQEMNRKFDNLMHNYEVNVTAVSEKLDISNAQSIQSEDLLSAQNRTIRFLEEEIYNKNELLATLYKDVELEPEKIKNADKFFRVMQEMYKKQLSELRTKLRKTRESVEDLDPMIDEEVRRLTSVFGRTIQIFSSNLERAHENNVLTLSRTQQNDMKNLSRTHENEIQTMRVTLSESNRVDRQKLESSYMSRFQAQEQKIEVLENLMRNNGKEIENQILLQGRKSEESHGSLSASFLSDEGDVSASESVMRGFLSALEGAGMFSNQEVEEVVLLASENRHPSYIASSSAKSLLSNCLSKISLELKKSKDEIIHLQKELKYEISEALREREAAKEREKMYGMERTILEGVDPSNMADHSEMSSQESSSNNEAMDFAVEELQRAKLDQNMLLDLARIESESQIKGLKYQIEDLQKAKEMEAKLIRTEAFELEQILKASFHEEINLVKKDAQSSLECLRKDIQDEQSRRYSLQAKLIESETRLMQKIDFLEEKNILLQSIADRAELKATEARMELLHSNVSSDL